jgi:hypothetical protein
MALASSLSFLLDANVISEIRRGRDPSVRAWISEVDDIELHFSAMTLGEIRKGIEPLCRRRMYLGAAGCFPGLRRTRGLVGSAQRGRLLA